MAYLIINNDEYKMKSIGKLHYTFPAALSHDKWHNFNIEHNAAKGFESLVCCKFVVHRKPEGTYTFRSQSNGKIIIQPLPGTPGNPGDLL